MPRSRRCKVRPAPTSSRCSAEKAQAALARPHHLHRRPAHARHHRLAAPWPVRAPLCAHTWRRRRAPDTRPACRAVRAVRTPGRGADHQRRSRPSAPALRRPPLPAQPPWRLPRRSLTFHSSTANSSPPMRATTSEARTWRNERRRDRLEHGVAGGVAVPVVDRLETVEIEIDQRGAGPVALDVSERALELALEAAAVERLGQRIDVDPRLELDDARACGLQLGGQRVRPRRQGVTLLPAALAVRLGSFRRRACAVAGRAADGPGRPPFSTASSAFVAPGPRFPQSPPQTSSNGAATD